MKDFLNFSLLPGLMALIFLTGCSSPGPAREQVYQGGALGTSYSIKLFAPDTADLQPRIDSVFRVVNQSLSTYLADSDISRINRGDTTVRVDEMFREVFEQSRRIHQRTKGYFDPTVGVLVDAWGFGPGEALQMDSLRVDSLLQYVGFGKTDLLRDNRIVSDLPGIRLDFNAIAKGYAIDRLAIMLDRAQVEHYLVEVGGELRSRGKNLSKGQAWVVGIEDPQAEDRRETRKIITLENHSLASSGNYRKFRIDSVTGQKYVHTIDPHTGFTRNSNVLATSVLAPTCMEADGYATAFMAMDLEDSMELLSEIPELEGYIIFLDGEGQTREFMTPGFEARVKLN